jgi:hypothetical protein
MKKKQTNKGIKRKKELNKQTSKGRKKETQTERTKDT